MNARTSGKMTRKEFIRRAGVGAAAVGAVAMGLSRTARAVSPPVGPGEPNPDGGRIIGSPSEGWVITPVGDPSVIGVNPIAGGYMTADSRNIQWAVQNISPGKTVLLKHIEGTPFWFPNTAEKVSFNVRVGPNVGCIISGETDGVPTDQFPNGTPLTTIKEGVALFNLTTQNAASPQTIILRNLLFDSPITHVAGSQPPHIGKTIIENCWVKNLRHLVALKYTWTIGFWSFQQGGLYEVKNNMVEIPDESPPWTPETFPSSPSVKIVGISMPYNSTVPRNLTANITNNTVYINTTMYKYDNRPEGTTFLTRDGAAGIALSGNSGPTTVSGNRLICRPRGIEMFSMTNATIEGNIISFPPSVNQPYPQIPPDTHGDYSDNYAIHLEGSSGNTIRGNVASGFFPTDPRVTIAAQAALLQFDGALSSFNNLSENYFGPTNGFGVVCTGNTNQFLQNVFAQSLDLDAPMVWVAPYMDAGGANNKLIGNDYVQTGMEGWSVSMDNKLVSPGCVLLDQGTSDNTVNETVFPPGTTSCTQVADLTLWNANPKIIGKNILQNVGQCNLGNYFQLVQKIKQAARYLENKARVDAMHAKPEGGVADPVWNEATQQWE
jgi:hypothetical protein